jgi:streptomycin 6-kinase
MGILMREDPEKVDVAGLRNRARWLAKRTDLDVTAVWEWGAVERVSTGLIAKSIGLEPFGSQMLAIADEIGKNA